MYRVVFHIKLLRLAYNLAAHVEREHLRLQTVVEQRLVVDHLRVEHHYRHRDSRLAQRHALVVSRHGDIRRPLLLQSLGKLVGSGSVAESLQHTHNFRVGLQPRPVEVEVVHQRVEVHLQHRFVLPRLEHLYYAVESEFRRALQQDEFLREVALRHSAEKSVGRRKESRVAGKQIAVSGNFPSDADYAVDVAQVDKFGNFFIQLRRGDVFRQHVGKNQSARAQQSVAARHKVDGRSKRQVVARVCVVNQLAVVYALHCVHPCSGGRQKLEPFLNRIHRHAHAQQRGEAHDGVFDVGSRRKRDLYLSGIQQIGVVDCCRVFLLDNRRYKYRSVGVDARPAHLLVSV